MNTEALRQRREAIVQEHMAAENSHDIERTIATFSHPRYDIPALGGVSDGAQAVQDLLAGLFFAFPDFHVAILQLHHADSAVIVEASLNGTHRGIFANVVPKGRKIQVPMAGIFQFEEDRLICEKVYIDMGTVMQQLQS